MDYGMSAKSCKQPPSNKRTFKDLSSCLTSLAPKKISKKTTKTKQRVLTSYTAEHGWVLAACSPFPRSEKAGKKLETTFFNDLFDPVQVVYINGKGELRLMMTLDTGDTRSIRTYENHAFAFFLPDSKECLFTHRIEKSDSGAERSMLDLLAKNDTQ
jgi:hypothetical protein